MSEQAACSTAGTKAGASKGQVAADAQERFIDDVMRDNAEFDHNAGSQPFVPHDQATALLQIFDDPTLRDVLQEKLAARFEPCEAKLETWRTRARLELGAAIETVIVKLAADHLRPDGMLQRLRDGVDAASFGVATLVTHLPAAS